MVVYHVKAPRRAKCGNPRDFREGLLGAKSSPARGTRRGSGTRSPDFVRRASAAGFARPWMAHICGAKVAVNHAGRSSSCSGSRRVDHVHSRCRRLTIDLCQKGCRAGSRQVRVEGRGGWGGDRAGRSHRTCSSSSWTRLPNLLRNDTLLNGRRGSSSCGIGHNQCDCCRCAMHDRPRAGSGLTVLTVGHTPLTSSTAITKRARPPSPIFRILPWAPAP